MRKKSQVQLDRKVRNSNATEKARKTSTPKAAKTGKAKAQKTSQERVVGHQRQQRLGQQRQEERIEERKFNCRKEESMAAEAGVVSGMERERNATRKVGFWHGAKVWSERQMQGESRKPFRGVNARYRNMERSRKRAKRYRSKWKVEKTKQRKERIEDPRSQWNGMEEREGSTGLERAAEVARKGVNGR